MDPEGRPGPAQSSGDRLDAGQCGASCSSWLLDLSYFFIEFAVALVAGSVSLLADSVDFLEDTAIKPLFFVALGCSPRCCIMAVR